MKILKFGGTSLGTSERINTVLDILTNQAQDTPCVAVVSAIGGVTDTLLWAGNQAQAGDRKFVETFESLKNKHFEIVKALNPNDSDTILTALTIEFDTLKTLLEGIFLIRELSPITSDKLLSYGELLSSYIVAETMKQRSLDVERKNAQELIVTNDDFTRARVCEQVTEKRIKAYFETASQRITIVPGFIATSTNGTPTTLGRGGSDFTAALIASALQATVLEIWTDVSGLFTSNPKLVRQAYPIPEISYQEAMELSHFGAKVLYPPTLQPVLNKNIPVQIKNTLKPTDSGTRISHKVVPRNNAITGISTIENIVLLTLQGSGMIGVPGVSKHLFSALAEAKINVILITQASSEHSICFAVDSRDAPLAKTTIDKHFKNAITHGKIDPIILEAELSIIALVGDHMKNHQGISGKMFSTLGRNNINIRAIAQGASERNISAVITNTDVKKALNALHEVFFEPDSKQLNVYVTGVGNVGERLIEQIKEQQSYLKEHLKTNLRIIGLSNSRHMTFDSNGINLSNWKTILNKGKKASLEDFFTTVKNLNLRNSIFVDITAHADVAALYPKYLRQSIGVVACNKIACSSDFKNYALLKRLALEYNASFLFETNVGAGLPIIDTLRNLIASGDTIISIQAVLSGSLNFVFNNFDDTTTFHHVVKQAQNEGYTEPDPRIDLSGIDVARKLLILVRESGITMNLEDIEKTAFLSPENLDAKDVNAFFDTLIANESHFQKLYTSAKTNDTQLKYVAQFHQGKARVGLEEIPQGHPFYDLKGKDNIVMFYTKRYPEQPLIVKGAGAGADVTASGIFADIIRTGNS